MKRLTGIAVAVALLALVSACGYDEGPAGRVIDKDAAYTGLGYIHTLTVRTADGEEAELNVSRLDHHLCYRGSAYPSCTAR
ncbi:hypothetical protein [Streptomyces sp. NPDC006368]|uniref:hypothetical protein n=1 Tax=Streptomyces sp. NPDC006368 TaxID=3156760 RepID=UPI00339E800F